MNKTIVWGLVIVAGLLFGWFYLNGDLKMSRNSTKTSTNSADMEAPPTDGALPAITDESMMAGDTKGGVGEMTITYTDSGFVPKDVTVKKGSAVRFVNNSTTGMWVASSVHPTHQVLPGFDQKTSVTKSGAYTYTFAKVGTWKFHNHVVPEITGSVVVTE